MKVRFMNKRGFSLLESLVALGILFLTLPVVLSLLTQSTRLDQKAMVRQNTLQEATHLLEEARRQVLQTREVRLTPTTAFEANWTIEPLESNDTLELLRIKVDVTPRAAAGASTTLETLELIRRLP
jgi:type II secretory pathway pseudopilin PulG